jgi:hypothetical protein
MNHPFAAFTLCIVGALAGCAAPSGPISLSISELGSEVQEDAGSLYNNISHRRSHNVTGLGSSETVGMLSADPDPPLLFRWPSLFSRKNLPDQLAPRISSECSRVAVHDLPMAQGKGIKEVLELRDSLDKLHGIDLRRLRLRAEAALVADITASFEAAESPDPAASASQAPNARAKQGTTQRDLLIAAWRKLAPSAGTPADASGWRARQTALTAEQAGLQTEFDAAEIRFHDARKEQGLIVARWEYQSSSQAGLGAAGISASANQTQTRTGFVVMGHPRTLTLISGDDLMLRACSAKGAKCKGASGDVQPGSRTGIDTMIPSGRLYTTTFQLLAEHLAWAEAGTVTQQRAFALHLSEIIKTIGVAGLDSLKSKLEAFNVEIGYGSRTSTSGENLGAVSGSQHWDIPFSFWDDDAYARSVEYQRMFNGRFLRVSSMRSTLDDYALNYGGKLPTAKVSCSGKSPTADEVKRITRIHLACDRLGPGDFLNTIDASDLAQRREVCSTTNPVQTGTQAALLDDATR